MANILNGVEPVNSTPVFPVPTNFSSSTKGEGLESASRLVVTGSNLKISKIGDTLTIGTEQFDTSYKNILDIVLLLQSKGIDITFLDNTDGWNLPAACIIDFTNEEVIERKLTNIPFDLESVNIISNKGLEVIEDTEVTVLLVLDFYNNKKSFTINKNYLTDITEFNRDHKIVYKVFGSDFLIKVNDNKFTTTKTDVLAKYMDVLHKND